MTTITGTRFRSFTTDRNITIGFYVSDCPACGVVYAITEDYEERRRNDGIGFMCPNGHTANFGTSRIDQEKKNTENQRRIAEDLRTTLKATRDQLRASERSKASVKGHLTRIRNRIANGVCPVPECQRSFSNVKAHIENEHPRWSTEHEGWEK